MRKLRWDVPDSSGSKHPVRDTVLVYLFLAGLVVAATAATGGSIVKGVVAGAAAFAVAMVYSWWRWLKVRRQEKGQE
jgi:membrane protein implicated in regulation of membrane protease activity